MSRPDAERVYICSRYAGHTEHNVRVALALCRMAVEAGLAPFAPHLLFTQFLDDGDPALRLRSGQAPREVGISLGLRFMEVCDVVWVYLGEGVSDGMRREIEHARRLGKPIVLLREVRPCVLT